MPKEYYEAEAVQNIASGLIPAYHPELATARIGYVFVSAPSKKGGRELFGTASKVTGVNAYLQELDFLIIVAEPKWTDLSDHPRKALVDHLLEHCTSEEQKDGSYKWIMREPDVHEFSSILQRWGIWHDGLNEMVSVAKELEVTTESQSSDELSFEDVSELDLNAEDVNTQE